VSENIDARLEWTLRIGAAMCFVGHGAFGVMTKAAWLPYFAVVGIAPATAFAWMPLIGAVDITMGCLVLLTPRPAVALWMVGWAVWTALLRPLVGEPVWEALERAGNYGVPLALLLRMTPRHVIRRVLAATVVLLLVGHGALSIAGKPEFARNLASVLPEHAAAALPLLGALELALAAAVALRPSIPLLLGVALWKAATEALFITAGTPIWEWIERGGSYAAPIALAIVLSAARRDPASRHEETTGGPGHPS
jgi:hypothetical protein